MTARRTRSAAAHPGGGAAASRPRLVRYVSPFGSPAWMTPDQARRLLAEDDARWLVHEAAGALSAAQLSVGAPRVEVPA